MPDWLSNLLENRHWVSLALGLSLVVVCLVWRWWFSRRTQAVRITADAVKARLETGEPMTVIDVPKQTARRIHNGRIGESVPVDLAALRPGILGPADQLTVVY
jgi:hypothetical protein